MTQEWIAYNPKQDKLRFIRARNQRQAIKKAVNKYNIVPQSVNDVRPRTGDNELMTANEFEEFLDAGLV